MGASSYAFHSRRHAARLGVAIRRSPRIVARQDLRLWHTVGSVLYGGLQWMCALVVLLKMRLLGAVLHDSARCRRQSLMTRLVLDTPLHQ